MFQRIIIVLFSLVGFACVTEHDPEATQSAPLLADSIDLATLVDDLVAKQPSVPTIEKIVADPATVVEYTSIEELFDIAVKASCATEPASATCSSVTASQQAWSAREDGCTRRDFCTLRFSGSLLDPSIRGTCRTCVTCCDVRNGQSSCRTSCTGPRNVVIN